MSGQKQNEEKSSQCSRRFYTGRASRDAHPAKKITCKARSNHGRHSRRNRSWAPASGEPARGGAEQVLLHTIHFNNVQTAQLPQAAKFQTAAGEHLRTCLNYFFFFFLFLLWLRLACLFRWCPRINFVLKVRMESLLLTLVCSKNPLSSRSLHVDRIVSRILLTSVME